MLNPPQQIEMANEVYVTKVKPKMNLFKDVKAVLADS